MSRSTWNPGEEVAEVEWAAAAGTRADLVQAVVGFADLAGQDVAAIPDRQQRVGALRGIRQQLHWHANPAYRYAARPDLMADPQWRLGLAEVTRRGLLFELQVFPGQYPQALQLVDDFPDTTFVLLPAGMPEERSTDEIAAWRSGMRQFARRPNVHVKLSGLGTFTRDCTTAGWRPVIEQTVDTFGGQVEHEKTLAYPETVTQAHADFAELRGTATPGGIVRPRPARVYQTVSDELRDRLQESRQPG